jgi:hypothetical protein
MIARFRWSTVLFFSLVVSASAVAFAQDEAKKSSGSAATSETQQPSKKKSDKKLSLADVTRVSTAEAAKNAAKESTKDNSKDQDVLKSADGNGQSGVLEFQPATVGDPSTSPAAHPEATKKHALSKVHGEAYGALDPKNTGTHRTGGAVGATTKSGKTSVYVETNQSKSTSNTPH